MDLGFDNGILLENQRRHHRWTIAPDKDLHRVVFHLASNALDITLGNDVSTAHHHDTIGDDIDFVEDVAGDDDVHAGFAEIPEEFDDFRPRHGVESVERLVKD